jgi:WD40 repeat protein
MIRHSSPISGIAAWRDRYVLTAGYDNQVILWDQLTNNAITRSCHDHLANQVSFSPDGRYALTSSSDYTARLWTIPDLRLVAVFADQEDDVEMSVFHPAKELIATASRDHRVRVYSFDGTLLHTFTGHQADVISVEWARGSDELISSSDDGTIKRWSLASDGLIDDLDMEGVETDTIAISAAGTIFAGNDEGQIIVIREKKREIIPAHNAGIKRLVLDDWADTSATWYRVSTLEKIDTIDEAHDRIANGCVGLGDEGFFASVSRDLLLRVWSPDGQVSVLDTPHTHSIKCVSASSDGRLIATGSYNGRVAIYDRVATDWVAQARPTTAGISSLAYAPDAKLFLASSYDGQVYRVSH